MKFAFPPFSPPTSSGVPISKQNTYGTFDDFDPINNSTPVRTVGVPHFAGTVVHLQLSVVHYDTCMVTGQSNKTLLNEQTSWGDLDKYCRLFATVTISLFSYHLNMEDVHIYAIELRLRLSMCHNGKVSQQ